jgi:hypothetical protein
MPNTITVNGLDFRVTDPTTYAARIAGDRRLVMLLDGSLWTLAASRLRGRYEGIAWKMSAPVEDKQVTAWCDCGWREKRNGSFYALVALDAHDYATH